LIVIDELGSYEAVVVQNPATKHADLADRVFPLEGIVIAAAIRCWSTMCPKRAGRGGEDYARFEITDDSASWRNPAGSPSGQWSSAAGIEIMEKLEALGASAILKTTITNCRLCDR